jgi:isopenicillin N synthase-like dioxygenase
MSKVQVPIIDIGPFLAGDPKARVEVPKAVARACEEIGFFSIIGHGVDTTLIETTKKDATAFFDLPVEEKQKARVGNPAVAYRGYRAVGEENLAATRGLVAPADFKEFFQISVCDYPEDEYHCGPKGAPHFMNNCWPERPANLRNSLTAYYNTISKLACDLMRISALALDLPENYFEDKMNHQISTLRVVNYPEQKTPPVPGQLRASPHSDYAAFTILHGENVPGSLQVLTRGGEWIDVIFAPNSFVINIGDMMMRWTNDKWVSTLHRVVNPPIEVGASSRRQSLVFFASPNYETDISCFPSCVDANNPVRYPSTTVGEYRLGKYAQAVPKKPVAA